MSEWKLVPVEPTEEMIRAGREKMDSLSDWNNKSTIASAVFRAMLAAAPAAPEVEPVAFRMRHHLETEERDWSVMPIRFLERNKQPVYVIELLYTQPAPPSGLVKAAEEYTNYIGHYSQTDTGKRLLANLCAELAKSK